MCKSQTQADTNFGVNHEPDKPSHPGPAATPFELEAYERALAEREDSHGFITRYAEAQRNWKLLSVNDPGYKKLVDDFRMREKIGLRSAGADERADVAEEKAKRKEKSKKFDLKKRLLRKVKT
ncbi:hypothetical protein IFR04_001628 [Cadophora malorum]|uniref:Uncharacterized protein n=1 Tax=Cadophora malorum TaxID=108018 RepID=A0A8H7WHY7_9HELO|nr:hypothetical protein IFR04_001628 [Cadophora malorum]